MVSYRVTWRCTLQGSRSGDLSWVQQVSFQSLPYYLLTPLWTTSYHKINRLQDKKVVTLFPNTTVSLALTQFCLLIMTPYDLTAKVSNHDHEFMHGRLVTTELTLTAAQAGRL